MKRLVEHAVRSDDVRARLAPKVRCVACGVRGRWQDGTVVNAEAHDVRPWCSLAPLRAHGPWVPA